MSPVRGLAVPVRGLAAAALGVALGGCGLLPGTAGEDDPIHPQTARAGVDVGILVPAWTQPQTLAYLCASRTPEADLEQFAWVNPRPDCLSLEVAHNGFELRGFYSFHSASARRRGAFDDAADWFLVLSWEGPPGGQLQVRVPGGPVLVD